MSANEYMGQGRISRLRESAMAPGVAAFGWSTGSKP